MTETQHTPEPWTAADFDRSQVVILGPKTDDGKRELVATCTGENRHANANLIASAPQLQSQRDRLLEVCKRVKNQQPPLPRSLVVDLCTLLSAIDPEMQEQSK